MQALKHPLGIALAAALYVAAPSVVLAGPIDLTTGRAVTATGVFGQLSAQGQAYPWCADATCPTAAASTLNDGVYLPSGTDWQQGTIWWDAHNPLSAENTLEIDFGGLFRVDFVSIQADNNDFYQIQLLDGGGTWVNWGFANTCCSSGVWERSSGSLAPTDATAARIYGFGGDGYYAVSEFQLTGTALAVPEPASLALVVLALGSLMIGTPRRR